MFCSLIVVYGTVTASLRKRELAALLFLLDCFSLFNLSLGVNGRIQSVIVALLGQLYYLYLEKYRYVY